MSEYVKLPVADIYPSPRNPRKTFDAAGIEELASNIGKQGLLQPITVRKTRDSYEDIDSGTLETLHIPAAYEIVCGERRFRAFKLLSERGAGYDEIPCIVREMTDEEAFDAMITENLQRQDVDPIEEAVAFSLLLENGSSLEDIAVRFGKSVRFVQDRVKLCGLVPGFVCKLRDGSIPVSGAMLLAKMDKGFQERLLETVGDDGLTYRDIKDYVTREFRVLDKAPFFAEDGFDESFPLCSACPNNTANYGCLFYEMKPDGQKCTDPECFGKKMSGYVRYRVMKEAGNLVKAGEPLQFGKSVIVIDEDGYCTDSMKEMNRKAEELYSSLGFEVVRSSVFSHRCWYSEDDARIREMLASHEIYRCINVVGYMGPEFKVTYYYVNRKNASGSFAAGDTKEIETDRIKSKMKRNKELVVEKSRETMREWASSSAGYSARKDELSACERLVLDAIVLGSCGYEFLDGLGLSGNRSMLVEYAENHQSERNRWYRAFIMKNLSDPSVTYTEYLYKCQTRLFMEQYPDKFEEMTRKLAQAYEKKDRKLRERLEELSGRKEEDA